MGVATEKTKKMMVVKSNAIIRSKWQIDSVWEPRIVALLAAKVQPDDADFKSYRISFSEIFAGHPGGGTTYKGIQATAEKLMSRVIIMDDPKSNKKSMYNVFSKCVIDPDSSTIEVCFHADLKPHYLSLKKYFTQYSLEEFMQLPSVYSQRLYELLASWLSAGEVEIPIDELYTILDVPASIKRDFTNFKNRVLDIAQALIIEKTRLYFEWLPIKTGKRKVTAIQFIFDKAAYEEKVKREQERQHDEDIEDVRKMLALVSKCRARLNESNCIWADISSRNCSHRQSWSKQNCSLAKSIAVMVS
jgi:plasmid replication initiation protein